MTHRDRYVMESTEIPMHRCGQYMRWNGEQWYCTCSTQPVQEYRVRYIDGGPMKPRPISEEPDTDDQTEIDTPPDLC